MRWLLLGLAAGCLAEAPAPSPGAPKLTVLAPPPVGVKHQKLIIGAQPVFAPEQVEASFQPFIEYLAAKLETPVELRVSATYEALNQALLSGEVDLAQLGPLSYVKVSRQSRDLVPLATLITEGSTSYSAFIVARDDLPISSIADLRGKRLGLVEPMSASGFLYPLAFLKQQGLDIEKDFASVEQLGHHDALVNAVLDGRVDIGATFSGALLQATQRGRPIERLRIIAKTGRIPNDTWVARRTLSPATIDAIRLALLSINSQSLDGQRILHRLGAAGFAAFQASDFRELERVVEQLDR